MPLLTPANADLPINKVYLALIRHLAIVVPDHLRQLRYDPIGRPLQATQKLAQYLNVLVIVVRQVVAVRQDQSQLAEEEGTRLLEDYLDVAL